MTKSYLLSGCGGNQRTPECYLVLSFHFMYSLSLSWVSVLYKISENLPPTMGKERTVVI